MIRRLAAVAALCLAVPAGSAAAQTWGQPVYVGSHGRVVGGTPLSEIETRSHVTTGRRADGYSDQAYVHVPAPAYGRRYGYGRDYGRGRGYGYSYGGRYDQGRHGYAYGRYESRPYQGYRDVWGYNDDRPPSARRWSGDRRHDGDCGCGDVYFYDR